ncbi:MAG TPA: hypothetical protein VF939_03760 [Puia sp.]
MKRMIPFLIMIAFCAACAGKREFDKNVAIEIKFAQTSKTDLKKDTYTLFYLSKPPLEIKLGLTEAERNRIVDAWYSLELDRLSGQTTVWDNCHSMPKIFTVIRASTATHSQEITIDAHCEDFFFFNAKKAERVKKFLKLVRDIILSRPAVRDAPKSDVFYM